MTMDHHSSSFSARSEQEEPFYSSGPQDPDDVLCEGSDTEQTAEEIREKRQRYEEVARRYLKGHRPLIQSASLRGPLDRESGWVNPWRYRLRKEADWWQPGSEDMMFTKENVMKRAADHGLGYLTPTEALAWCKAAAEAEARKEFDQFDSMEAVQSGELDMEGRGEESPTDGLPEPQPYSKIEDDGHRTHPEHATDFLEQYPSMTDAQFTDGRDTNNSAAMSIRGTKRPAESQWLKRPYISKRARWEKPPVSSPTPMSDQQSERDRRRRHGSASSAGSGNGQQNVISQPKTPWSHDARQRRADSRYSGGAVQGPESNDGGMNSGRQVEDLDELQEDSRETIFVSAPDFHSRSQGKTKRTPALDRSFSDLKPDDLTITSINTPAARWGTSASRPSGSGSNKLPKLPRSPQTRDDGDVVEDDSFITEVAPSSRNLEKFQYRKKRRKSKKHRSSEGCEASFEQLKNTARSLLEQAPADGAEEPLRNGPSFTINPAQQLQLESRDHEVEADHETTPGVLLARRGTISPEEDLIRMPVEASSESSQFNDNYFKKVIMMPDNILPSLDMNSPFAPFSTLAFGPFSTSKATSTPRPAMTKQPSLEIVEDAQHPVPTRPEKLQMEDVPAASPIGPQNPNPATSSSEIAAEFLPMQSSPSSHTPSKHCVSLSPVYQPRVADTPPTPDPDILPMSSSPQTYELENIPSPNPLPDSPENSQPTPKIQAPAARYTQETTIVDDSTQSYNSTVPKSSHKLHTSSVAMRTSLVVNEDVIEDVEMKISVESHQDEMPREINHKTTSALYSGDANPIDTRFIESADSPKEEGQDTLSQGCGGVSSGNSTQIDNDNSSQPSISGVNTESKPGKTTPLEPEETDDASALDDELVRCEGCGPQSPWAVENLLQQPTSKNVQLSEPFVTVERGASPDISSSPTRPTFEETSEWQPVEHPLTPDNDVFEPLRNISSPTPSREQPETHASREVVSTTQLLIEAATTNPWMSNSKKRASGKSKKRVSFGVHPEEKLDLQVKKSSSLKRGPGSPPLPQSMGRPFDEDAFDDSPIPIGKLAKHFSAASGLEHLLPKSASSQALSSPAVVAMADRFIAADREFSIEQERRSGLRESPSRHLMLKSDARTNLSPSETTDHDMELNLDDFISDASNFLEDWSVDSEIKKTSRLKAKRDNENGQSQSTRRSLFGFTNVWA